jgi:hypothetical protein
MEPEEDERKSAGESERKISEMPSGKATGRGTDWMDLAAAETAAVAAQAHHEGYRSGINDAFRAISVLLAAGIATYIVVSRQETLH